MSGWERTVEMLAPDLRWRLDGDGEEASGGPALVNAFGASTAAAGLIPGAPEAGAAYFSNAVMVAAETVSFIGPRGSKALTFRCDAPAFSQTVMDLRRTHGGQSRAWRLSVAPPNFQEFALVAPVLKVQSFAPTDNAPHLFLSVIDVDASPQWRIYLDGAPVWAGDLDYGPTIGAAFTLAIGGNETSPGSGGLFSGVAQDAMIWTDRALSAEDAALLQAGWSDPNFSLAPRPVTMAASRRVGFPPSRARPPLRTISSDRREAAGAHP